MTEKVMAIVNRIQMNVLGIEFGIRVGRDQLHTPGRVFLQCVYMAPCTKTGEVQEWGGRKWYLSEFMTDDEIVKTAWCAFEAAVKHEVMEGFKVDGKILFNPHVHYMELLAVSEREVRRVNMQTS